MLDLLSQNAFLIEEQATPLRAEYAFDVRTPDGRELLATCREPPLGRLRRILRFSTFGRTTPFDLRATTPSGQAVVRLARGVPVTYSRVRVFDGDGMLIGSLRQRAFSLRGAFDVLDATDRPLCRLQGRATGSEFALLTPDAVQLARITKSWAGLGKELLTSADHYLLEVDDVAPPDPVLRQLILAAAIGIGLIVKFEIP